MMAHPGKKLLFMGQEFAQFIEWNENQQLDWLLLGYDRHREMREYVKALNHLYLATPAMWQVDYSWQGFQWIVPDDNSQSIVAFIRRDAAGGEIIALCNFAPVHRPDYKIGVPRAGIYRELLNSDDTRFGGSGILNAPMHSHKKADARLRAVDLGGSAADVGGAAARARAARQKGGGRKERGEESRRAQSGQDGQSGGQDGQSGQDGGQNGPKAREKAAVSARPFQGALVKDFIPRRAMPAGGIE